MKITNYAVICLQLVVLVFVTPAFAKASQKIEIQKVLDEAYHKFKTNDSGKNADYIPALAKVDSSYFGVALVTNDGKK